jgi:hypothetical protein
MIALLFFSFWFSRKDSSAEDEGSFDAEKERRRHDKFHAQHERFVRRRHEIMDQERDLEDRRHELMQLRRQLEGKGMTEETKRNLQIAEEKVSTKLERVREEQHELHREEMKMMDQDLHGRGQRHRRR